ncbi:MAG: LysM domain-containing protein, partial [Paracoccaceae bacterium]
GENSPYQPRLNGVIVQGAGFEAASPAASGIAAPMATAPESAPPAAAPMAMVYVVKSGDTLWDIAKANLGDATLYTKIVEANGLASGAVLAIGQELKLPK